MSNEITLDSLKQQLAQLEADFEGAKAQVYKIDGAIAVTKHMIERLSNPVDSPVDSGAATA